MKLFTALALLLSCGSWMPVWIKALRTKRTRDYSILSISMVLSAQILNLGIAYAEHASATLHYFIGNGLLVGLSLLLILRYR